jgi:carbamate kinase
MRIVIAVGGNAITQEGQVGTWDEQRTNARVVADGLVALRRRGHRLVLTHGNGPQVGALHLQHWLAARQAPPLPLDALVAMTQGQIGYLLQTAVEELDPSAATATVLTRVLVDPDDAAFAEPTKPIGPFYDEAEARALAAERGWTVAPDAGRGWRCVVASPRPTGIADLDAVLRLVESDVLVIAAGGGGIPVSVRRGRRVGVEAVIDKDRASGVLADAVSADMLVLLTGVARVALDFGTRWQRDMAQLRVSDALRLLEQGEFPPGSMGPKVEAAAQFAAPGGRVAVVTSAARLAEAIEGRAGTRIVADAEGTSLSAVETTAPVAA